MSYGSTATSDPVRYFMLIKVHLLQDDYDVIINFSPFGKGATGPSLASSITKKTSLFFGEICCCGTLWPHLPFPPKQLNKCQGHQSSGGWYVGEGFVAHQSYLKISQGCYSNVKTSMHHCSCWRHWVSHLVRKRKRTGADQHDFTRNGDHVDIGIEPFLLGDTQNMGYFQRNRVEILWSCSWWLPKKSEHHCGYDKPPSHPKHTACYTLPRSGFESVHYHGRAPGEGVEVLFVDVFFHSMWTWLLTHFLGTIDCHSDSYSP